MSTASFNGETKFLQEVLNPYKLERSFVLAFSMLSSHILSSSGKYSEQRFHQRNLLDFMVKYG